MIDVPVGVGSEHWVTVAPERTVLVIGHNITTMTRLLDVLPAFDSDFRVQVVASWSGTDPFHRGLKEAFDELGIVVMPWDQAIRTRFDLAITASHHGGLTDTNAPLVILSHGIGYTKNSPGNRKPETGNRKPETGNRKPETGNRKPETFGLSPQWVLYNGKPIAEALVLSHPEQLARLEAIAAEAADTAVIAGDPCYDRMLASLDRRNRYRRAFGAIGDRKLIVLSSTWSPDSLLGTWPDLTRQLLAELPVDEYQLAAIVHPNIWQGHGSWQVRTWLADSVRAGLTLIPPLEGWRAALIAADCVIGDNGATTCYGAALGRPTLLAAFPSDNVAAGSPVDALGRIAPRLDNRRPLREQIDEAISRHSVEKFQAVTDLVTSEPLESVRLLRSVFYRVLGLPEPAGEPILPPIPLDGLPATPPRPTTARVRVEFGSGGARVVRYPAEVQAHALFPAVTDDHHLVSHIDHPGRALRSNADVLFCYEAELDEPAEQWLSGTRATCEIIAVVSSDRTLLRTDDGQHAEFVGLAPDVYASVAYEWMSSGRSLSDLATGITVHVGQRSDHVTVRVW
ncbi:hypothetical protein ACIRG5_28240 [Lentzea sp. NPDC102401]|uniref:hypothetical protein n=1 Tax=Lentzea sp. NPDC102401 TaxID=3364128 RepID=UPI0037FAF66D